MLIFKIGLQKMKLDVFEQLCYFQAITLIFFSHCILNLQFTARESFFIYILFGSKLHDAIRVHQSDACFNNFIFLFHYY